MTFTDIINDEGFRKWSGDHTKYYDIGFNWDMSTELFFALHKTREAINKKAYSDGGLKIIINEYCVQASEMHIGAVETVNIYFFKDYNNQEIEALAAALDFIRIKELK